MSEVGNAQVAVFPTFEGFRSKVNTEVSGAAKEAGKSFTTSFKGAAQIEVDTSRLTRAVGQAGSVLARARQKQATDAGRVRVAEAQLAEAIEKTGRNSARTVAAEEKLAAAQRGLENSSERTEAAVKDLAQAQERLKTASNSMAAAGKRAGNEYAAGWAGAKQRIQGVIKGAVTRGSAGAGGTARSAGKGLGGSLGLGMKAGIVGVLASLTIGAITQPFEDMVAEGTEAFKVGRLTANAIKQTGASAWISAKQVGDLSQALSDKIGVDDEAIQSGANLLLTFKNVRNEAGKGGAIFDRATAAAQDLAAAGFGSAESASKTLGKALNDPVKGMTALGRAGVTFSEAQKKRIKQYVKEGDLLSAQKLIMSEVESQVGGAAAASSTAAEKLAVKWSNLQEEMGTRLLPAVSKVADALGPILTKAVDGAMPAIEGLSTGVQGLTEWLAQNPAVMEGFSASMSLAGDTALGLAHVLGPVLGFVAVSLIKNFSAITRTAADMLGALGTVPGFQWAADASVKLHKVADGADAVATGIENLGKAKATPDITVENEKAKAEIVEVDKQLKSLHDKVVKAKATGDTKEVDKLRDRIAKLKDKKVKLSAEVKKTGISTISVAPKGGKGWKFSAYRSGGLIGGYGTGTSDSNLIAASRGEYMFRQRAVQKIGQKALDYMNETGNLPAVPVAGGGSSAPTVIYGNVYGDHYLNQINRRNATRSKHMMQREGFLT